MKDVFKKKITIKKDPSVKFNKCLTVTYDMPEIDIKTQLKELNGIIKNFKENTDKKYEVKINLSFSLDSGIVTLSRERKPYLKIVKNK